ncbi:DUF222 domain-containing protein [Microbispora hainanensis]|uniref:DUF222 domain-containing protein n=2 Tax=Microbispora hainanensis TaxID=568844 RepID=A0A544YQI5_9ACTN|nr:HNH endonuclease signature motif containing protein [Microbispora hainanensis]TQS19028.1 DUF222 domain-containing protein [Microbispora hainanensis]
MDLFDIDPERLRRSNDGDGEWWDRLIANSPLWSSDGSSAREPFPIIGLESQRASLAEAEGDTDTDTDSDTDSSSGGAPGAGQGKGRSSWVVVGSVREVAQELALAPLPDDVDTCLAEAEELLFARDRITCALADRVGRVHRAGQAKQHGHASTRSWLRTAGGMTVGGAGRLLMLGAELPRLPVVREKFAVGELAAGVVEAICAAVAGLSDENAALAEPILVELAGKAGAAEVAKAGRHLRAVLDPDGEERDEQADYERRFLRVRPGKGGGVEGEFYIPREPGARLMTLLQEYAKKKADGDDRTLTERQADALIAALEQQIVTELLVVVSAESLPTDPENTDPENTNPAADNTGNPAPAEADDLDTAEAEADAGAESAGDTGAPVPAEADDTSGYAPDATGSADDPSKADDAVPGAMSDSGAECAPDAPSEFDTAEAEAEAESGAGAGSDADADGAADAGATSGDGTCDIAEADVSGVGTAEADLATGPVTDSAPAPGPADVMAGLRDEESRGCGVGECGAGERRPGECVPRDTASTASPEGDHGEGDETVNTSSAEGDDTAPVEGDGCIRGVARSGATYARQGAPAWPAGGGGHSDTASSDTASSGGTASDAPPSQASGAARPDPPPEDPSAHHTHAGPRPAGDCRHGQGTPGTSEGASSGAAPGGAPGGAAGTLPGAFLGTTLGASLGMVPGLLLATGQVLPVSSVHRLARTSTLVRIVMNADGQVLDMGRKVRLATPAQRRAVFARYATCWIDGCPLPATMCQIDHADNWSSGGLTDLKLLGPACQFHNRDRYQHPERYTRRKEGIDRWAFTYHRLGRARRLRE